MKKLLSRLRSWITKQVHDPVFSCEIYKMYGCSNVDGLMCDVKNCPILIKYRLQLLEERLDTIFKDNKNEEKI